MQRSGLYFNCEYLLNSYSYDLPQKKMINDTPNIDMAVEYKDGSVSLVIVISGITPTDENIDILNRKVDNYLQFIASEDFKEKYPKAVLNTRIVLLYSHKPPARFVDLEDELRLRVGYEGAKLEIKPQRYGKYYVKKWWEFWV